MDITQLLNDDAEQTPDVDARELQAAMVVQKLAHEHGVNLEEDLSPEEYAELVNAAREANDKVAAAQQPAEEQKMAADQQQVDERAVLSEIVKRAAAQGVDINELTDEEFVEVHNKIAEQLSDPGYHQEIESYQQKVASHQEAYDIGQSMSAGFLDGLNAAGEDPNEEDKLAGWREEIGKRVAGAGKAVSGAAESTGKKILDSTKRTKGMRDWTKNTNAAGEVIGQAKRDAKTIERINKAVGGGAMAAGGAAAVGGGAMAAKKLKGSKEAADAELEQAIHARALELIEEAQNKLAQDADFEEQFESAAIDHAMALLAEAEEG